MGEADSSVFRKTAHMKMPQSKKPMGSTNWNPRYKAVLWHGLLKVREVSPCSFGIADKSLQLINNIMRLILSACCHMYLFQTDEDY